jgi:hypothetical protein
LVVQQHYRIGQLQGGGQTFRAGRHNGQNSHGPDDPAQQKARLGQWPHCWRLTDNSGVGLLDRIVPYDGPASLLPASIFNQERCSSLIKILLNTLRTGIFFLYINHKSLIQSKVTFF